MHAPSPGLIISCSEGAAVTLLSVYCQCTVTVVSLYSLGITEHSTAVCNDKPGTIISCSEVAEIEAAATDIEKHTVRALVHTVTATVAHVCIVTATVGCVYSDSYSGACMFSDRYCTVAATTVTAQNAFVSVLSPQPGVTPGGAHPGRSQI